MPLIRNSVSSSLRKLRLKAVWLLILPFYYFAAPDPSSLALGVALGGIGLGIRGWAAGSIEKNRELAINGPYAYTRNPLYLGSFFLGLGVTAGGGQWAFVALFLAFYLTVYRATALREEAELEEMFGEPYRMYSAAVPFFVPRFTPYRSSNQSDRASRSFSLGQYVRNREWEAALGAIAGFGGLVLKMVLLG